MTAIHTSPISSHGNLTSDSCMIDSRFSLKIADYGLPFFRNPADLVPPKSFDPSVPENENLSFQRFMWRAPELLRQLMPAKGTQVWLNLSFHIFSFSFFTFLTWSSTKSNFSALSRCVLSFQRGDVYSFAIILQQIILRSGPFELPSEPLEISNQEIIKEV